MTFPADNPKKIGLRLMAMLLGWLAVVTENAPAQALPEPGVVLYGSVTNSATGAALTNGTVTYSFTNGANVAVVSGTLTNVNGEFLYVAEVPFETVMAGMTLSTNTLALPTGSTSIGRGAKFNGTNATILAASGASFSIAPADRGLQLRVNLQVTPTGASETYEAWSTRFFGTPNADPNADPDGDGRTNLQEYQDGTNPTDAASLTRSLAVTVSGSGTVARSPNLAGYANGATVTLTATPQPGFFFTGWSGGVTASTNPLTLVMAQSYAVTASFSSLSNAFAVFTNAQTVSELALLTVTNRATNVTATSLRFALAADALAGMALDTTNGVFTWTPSEAQGPSSNLVTVLVSDTNNPSTSATQQMVVLVTEVNLAPVLAAVGTLSATVGIQLSHSLAASDSDLPPNALTFELLSSPAGMQLGFSSGVLSWIPVPGQAGTSNFVTLRVVDNGSPPLSATQSFSVLVASLPMPEILRLDPTNAIFVARTNLTNNLPISLSVVTSNATSFQWTFGGLPITDATNATLTLPDVRRTNSGSYAVTVTGSGGSITTNALLHVATPQRVRKVERLSDGSIRLFFNEEDGTVAADLSRFRVQATTNLMKPETNILWLELSGSFAGTNGFVLFQDAITPGVSRRFYRVIER